MKILEKQAFTLMELMVVIIIIAVLAAIAVPQYKKAVLKSRFSTLMPMAKALADANEVYYLANGEYAEQEAQLDVEGQISAPTGTEIVVEEDPDHLSYVRIANNDQIPNARYVVYQEHSANFAGTTMCEARDDAAKELCKSLGGVFISEGGTQSDWTSYLLSGQPGARDAFARPCLVSNGVCNYDGELTGCDSGYYVSEGDCAACPANSTGCNENGEISGCETGYYSYNNACRVSHAGDYDYAEDSVCTGDCNTKTFGDNASCQKQGNTTTYCGRATFTDNAMCSNDAICQGVTFDGESSCSGATCDSSNNLGTTKFKDHASCTNNASCYGVAFSGESTCDGATCNAWKYGIATFTDNARCLGNSRCQGAVFSGNSSCTSTYYNSGTWNSPRTEGGCSANYTSSLVSTFKDNAVCAGTGCDTANYEDNACCAGTSCPSGVKKCVYNSQTGTYDRDGEWE